MKRKRKNVTTVSRIVSAIRRVWFWSPERRAALKAAGGVCECCGTSEKLEVHHKDVPNIQHHAEKIHAGLFPPIDRLEVLCRSCHRREHDPT